MSAFPDRIGGTSGWMAPEHRAALEAVAGANRSREPVDTAPTSTRSGALLREALGGARQMLARASVPDASWRRRNVRT